MWTRHSEWNANGPLQGPKVLEEEGPTVRLLSQGGDHQVTFVTGDGQVGKLPSHIFFGTFREATPDEIDDFAPREAPALPLRGKGAAVDATT